MLNEYRIVAVLGVGGFGITYLASDTHLEKDVAIKEYFPSGTVSRKTDTGAVTIAGPHVANEYRAGLDRFLKEARTLASFGHPNIVRVLRFFQANDTGYMVMDYERGKSLREWLHKNPQPDEETLLTLIAPLLDGIEKVHAAGFLHRDNVFIRDDGSPVLIDFGSARQASSGVTKTMTAMVTPGYAPFEQYGAGADQGPYTDIYAMGGVLVYAMTGRNPPDAITRMKNDRLGDELSSASLRYSPRVIDAVRHAMAVDEKLRPQTIADWRPTLLGEIPAATGRFTTSLGNAKTQRVSTSDVAAAMAAAPPQANPDTQDIGKLLAQREALDAAVKQKFQRVLTVMFTDLKGSTAIAESAGDIAVRAMLKSHHDMVIEAVKTNGGTLVKTIGDGSLSHFEHALDACRAAAAIQRAMEKLNLAKTHKALLLARIGMHTGECLLEKNDVFGDVVNTASRFESSANPGEIFISEDTYNAISDKTEFYGRFDREVTLKGKSQPFKGYIIFWDPKEIERDRAARPVIASKPSTPAWKIAAWIGVPLAILLVAAVYITSGGKFGGEATRSINYSVPQK
jgi:class 3 adenylate cyclase